MQGKQRVFAGVTVMFVLGAALFAVGQYLQMRQAGLGGINFLLPGLLTVTALFVGVMVIFKNECRKVTSRLLERNEMDVVTAKDGVEAVAMLQEQVPDIMLLDIEMPRMDGFELARHINNSVDYYGLPIIMISSRVGDKHRQRAMGLGVKKCLGKPYQEAELLDSINQVLAESRR